MGNTISILGLGWLGLPLAKYLLSVGFVVKGSVTSKEKKLELQHLGIDISIVKVSENKIEISDEDFFDTDILLINIPPVRVSDIETYYPSQIQQIYKYVKKHLIDKVIFISSTSVYPENNKTYKEILSPKPDKVSGIACLKAEQVLFNDLNFDTTVIRFGGLIGAGRNPYRFMSRNKKNGPGKKPVNLIHLDDCIGIIEHIIIRNVWNSIINACCPEHPTREDFYTEAAQIAGVEPPLFDDASPFQFKKISSAKITGEMGYHFKYSNPIKCLRELE